MQTIFDSPAGWRPTEITTRRDWIHHFEPAEVDEILTALATVRERGLGMAEMEQRDFPLPTVARRLAKAREVLEDGPGLYLFRGFPATGMSKADLRTIYWGLGRHMGTAVSQSKNGDVLGDVRNIGVDMHSAQGRGYTSNQQLTYHTDSCDVVGLFVLCTARAGGLSRICSSVAVHHEIARTRPDLLEVLYQPFHWSWQGQEEPGGLPYYPQPIFSMHEGRFSCRYVRTHIISAQRFEEVPRLTPQQQEAMALLDSLAGSERFHYSMMFEPGDIQFLNNHVTLHSRTAFEDHEEPARKRHLLRMWLSVPNSRALSPLLGTIYRDQRAGAVRGGFPSRTGHLVYETAGSIE
jgi:hypothetical protein